MNTPRNHLHAALATALLLVLPLLGQEAPAPLAPVAGQDAPTRLAPPAASPIRPAADTPTGPSTELWASGERYKVRFDAGMTYFPFVGPSLPHQPFGWRTVSVRAGGRELLQGRAPARRNDEWRCEFDHGAVVERYDVRPDGLEQSFVIPQRPVAGDLVVTGALTTPLRLSPRERLHAPLSLQLPDGREVIEYGVAFAIDATGAKTALTTAVVEGNIELRVPAEVVATAAFPLCIDPLVGTTLLGAGIPVTEVDVLHETISPTAQLSRMWVAEAREVAANDRDVNVYRYGGAFAGGTHVYRAISTWDEAHPRLALAAGDNQAVVVHSVDSGPLRLVVVHKHQLSDLALRTSQIAVPGGFAESMWRPDVGGRRNLLGSRVLIVYQREAVAPFAETATSQIWATVFDVTQPQASAFVVAPFALRQLNNRDQERPEVVQSTNTDWLVTFQEHQGNVVNDDWDIETLAVSGTGVVSPSSLTTADAADIGRHKVGPKIAGSEGRYLLTYATRPFVQTNPKPTSPEGDVIRSQRIDWDHNGNTGTLAHPVVDMFTAGGVTLRAQGLAFDYTSNSHWCAGVRADLTTSYRIHKLGYTGNVVESASIPLATGATPDSLAIAFNEDSRSFPLVYAENDPAVAGNNLLQADRMQYDAVQPPTLRGFPCSSGVWTNVAGLADRQQIGSEDLLLRMANSPQPNSLALLFFSTAELQLPGGLFGAPGCDLFPDLQLPNYLGAVTVPVDAAGAASMTLDLPEYLAPMTLTLQWVYLVNGINPLGMVSTEGLRLQLGR